MKEQKSLTERAKESSFGLPCFVCDVDSTELKTFMILVICCLVLASLFVWLGLFLRGYFSHSEDIKDKIFEIEQRQ